MLTALLIVPSVLWLLGLHLDTLQRKAWREANATKPETFC